MGPQFFTSDTYFPIPYKRWKNIGKYFISWIGVRALFTILECVRSDQKKLYSCDHIFFPSQISEFGAIDSESIWFIHGNLSFLDSSSQILLSSNFYLFDIYESYIVVSEVYRKANYLPLISKIWGIWSPAIGLVHNEAFIWSRRRDLNGVKLKCATLPYGPHIFTGPINGIKFSNNM